MVVESSCPCGNAGPYAACCGRFVDLGEIPTTAEQLMRSRYAAFTQANEAYLLATWHERTRPARLNLDETGAIKWLGLRINRVTAGGAGDDHGEVCFVARWRVGGERAQRQSECSRFERVNGRWYYLDGEIRT